VLPAQHAVYLKYNQCRDDSGFQRLTAQALALLRAHPDDRLIVDLRDNPGGDSGPFQSLTAGIAASPALRAPGRVIGLVNEFTDSAATVDAQSLKQAGTVLIGQPAATTRSSRRRSATARPGREVPGRPARGEPVSGRPGDRR
jgi:C-terminal processing protease CtpA/Prc